MDIDAGIVEDDIPGAPGEEFREHFAEPPRIGCVVQPVLQADVEVGGDLANRVVLRAMHGKGEGARLVAQDVGGAVALVHVEIDDQNVPGQPLVQQDQRRHGHVVEGAEAGALRAPRMVAAAGGVAGDAMAQRKPGRKHRAARRKLRAPRHARIHGEADLALDKGRHRAGQNLFDIGRVMRQFEPCGRRRLGLVGVLRTKQAAGLQRLDQQRVLAHGKAVAGDEAGIVVAMMDDGERQAE